jgi:hypothetical protein
MPCENKKDMYVLMKIMHDLIKHETKLAVNFFSLFTLIGEDLCLYNACFNFSNINISDIYIGENISHQVYLPFIYM